MMPPDRPSELATISDVTIEPSGVMKKYLGERIPPEMIPLNTFCTAKDRRLKNVVRAYHVKALIGEVISVKDDRKLNEAILKCLQNRMPDIDWPDLQISLAILRKYMFIHHCFKAPCDEALRQQMCIELLAYVIKFGKNIVDEKKRQRLRVSRFVSRSVDETVYLNTPIVDYMEVKIEIATYSNISYPGYGIPCYL
jgi:hypothetical protein